MTMPNEKRLNLNQLGWSDFVSESIRNTLIKNTKGIVIVAGASGAQSCWTSLAMIEEFRDLSKHCNKSAFHGSRHTHHEIQYFGAVESESDFLKCLDTALGGHQVIVSIECTRIEQIIIRLLKWAGPKNHQRLVDSLNLIMVQELVPTLCPECRGIVEITPDQKEMFANIVRFDERCASLSESFAECLVATDDFHLTKHLPKHAATSSVGLGCTQCLNGKKEAVPVCDLVTFDENVADYLISADSDSLNLVGYYAADALKQKLQLLRTKRITFDAVVGL